MDNPYNDDDGDFGGEVDDVGDDDGGGGEDDDDDDDGGIPVAKVAVVVTHKYDQTPEPVRRGGEGHVARCISNKILLPCFNNFKQHLVATWWPPLL